MLNACLNLRIEFDYSTVPTVSSLRSHVTPPRRVCTNVTGLTRVYQEGRVLVFGLTDADAQRATFDRFKTLRDGDKPITVEYIGDAPPAVISGLNVHPTGIMLTPVPNTPSRPPASQQLSDSPSIPGDVPMTDTPDATKARFQAIEGNIQALNGKIEGLGNRMDTMANSIANDIVKQLAAARDQTQDRSERADMETPPAKRFAAAGHPDSFLPRPDGLAYPAIGNAAAFPVKCCVINKDSHAITVVNVANSVTAGPDGRQLIRITPLDTQGTLHPEFATTITTNCLFLPDGATNYQAGLQALAQQARRAEGLCPLGCSVLGRGAEPLVRTQFLEHPPTLSFGANHLKKWIQHPQKPPIPFLSPHNPHCRGRFFWGGGVKELEHS